MTRKIFQALVRKGPKSPVLCVAVHEMAAMGVIARLCYPWV